MKIAIALAAITLFLFLSFALSRRSRLLFAVPFSVIQLYVPGLNIGGYPPPIALAGALLLWPEFLSGLRVAGGWQQIRLIVSLGAMYAVALLWSVDMQLGLRRLVYLWAFLAIFFAMVVQGRRNYTVAIKLIAWTTALAPVQAASIVVFRIFPVLKIGYLKSHLAELFINANMLQALFTIEGNNALDPLKSGGLFFTNANVAGAHMAILAFTALGIGFAKASRWQFAISGVCFISIFFTGSKAALALAVIGALCSIVVLTRHDKRLRARLFIAASIVIPCVVTSLFFLGGPQVAESPGAIRSFAANSDATLEIRQQIWGYAAKAFFSQPLLGQGFGGWQAGFGAYARYLGISEGFPPHDTFIYMWSQGGLIAAILGVCFAASALVFSARQLKKHIAGPGFGVALAMTGSFSWIFIHGLGENFGLLGEEHMMPVLASLLALGYLQRKGAFSALREGPFND